MTSQNVSESQFWPQLRKKPLSRSALAVFLVSILVISLLCAWPLINKIIDDETSEIFAGFYSRADALAWAVEGAARFATHGKERADLARLLKEMSQQPGVAWLAIVAPDGKILLDSSPGLAGVAIYTPAEMRLLAPEYRLKGRISPDDPNIYEAWRLFAPGRVHSRQESSQVIFVALNAAFARESIDSFTTGLWIMAMIAIVCLLALAVLIFLVQNYHSSRISLGNALALTSQILAAYPDAMFITDGSGHITLLNDAARELLHLRPGSDSRQAFGFDWDSIYARLNRGEVIREEEAHLAGAGQAPVPVSFSAAPILRGKNAGHIFSARDLGEIKKLRRKLAETRRQATLSNIAAGIAHEIRNPLSSIRGYALYLAKRLESDPIGQTSANLLVEETGRLDNVLNGLLHLARPKTLDMRRIDLAEILRKACRILEPDLSAKKIDLVLDVPTHAPFVGDSGAMLQCFLNLMLNAIQALQTGGRLEAAIDGPEASNAGEKNWRIVIRDNGPGISAGRIDQIFTPYYTTRPNGTGLGLPLVQQIAALHDGAVTVSSTPGQGAVFSIILPAELSGQPDE